MTTLIAWDIYEISTTESTIHGVKVRGRIRKFGLVNNMNILAENASDAENRVRFAVFAGTDVSDVIKQIQKMIPDASVERIRENIINPVLSKLKVNIEDRYEL